MDRGAQRTREILDPLAACVDLTIIFISIKLFFLVRDRPTEAGLVMYGPILD